MLEVNGIYLGDSLELIKSIDDESIDMVLTDPPYQVSYKTNRRKNKEHRFCQEIENDNNPDIIKEIIPELYRVLKNNSAIYMFCSYHSVDLFKKLISEYFEIKNIIVWVKNNHSVGDLKAQFAPQYELIVYANKGRRFINGKRISDVWFFDRIVGKNQLHQNQKPISLLRQCIVKSSSENDVILDPFSGSASTAVACLEEDRKFICIEKDPYYYDVSISRVKTFLEGSLETFKDDANNLANPVIDICSPAPMVDIFVESV